MYLYKKIILSLAFIIFVLIEPAFATGYHNKEIFLKKAAQYYYQNRLDKAISLYSQVLKNDPYNQYALINITAAFIKKGLFSEAYPYTKRFTSRYPDKPEGWINMAICEIGLGRLKQALTHLDMAEKRIDCPDFIIYMHKGIIFSKMGKVDEALRFYKKAEIINPDDPALIFNMALLYAKKKDYKDALLYYQRYLQRYGQQLSSSERTQIREMIRWLRKFSLKSKEMQ